MDNSSRPLIDNLNSIPLEASVSAPHMLVTSVPQGVISITRNPESGGYQVYMPVLDKDTLMRSLRGLRISVSQVGHISTSPMNHNHNNN